MNAKWRINKFIKKKSIKTVPLFSKKSKQKINQIYKQDVPITWPLSMHFPAFSFSLRIRVAVYPINI